MGDNDPIQGEFLQSLGCFGGRIWGRNWCPDGVKVETGTSGNLGWESPTSRGDITAEMGRMGQALQKLLAGRIHGV